MLKINSVFSAFLEKNSRDKIWRFFEDLKRNTLISFIPHPSLRSCEHTRNHTQMTALSNIEKAVGQILMVWDDTCTVDTPGVGIFNWFELYCLSSCLSCIVRILKCLFFVRHQSFGIVKDSELASFVFSLRRDFPDGTTPRSVMCCWLSEFMKYFVKPVTRDCQQNIHQLIYFVPSLFFRRDLAFVWYVQTHECVSESHGSAGPITHHPRTCDGRRGGGNL